MIHVGFTGSQHGLTEAQERELGHVLWGLAARHEVAYLAHGDCVGADERAHEIALTLGYLPVVHPPDNESKRAFVVGWHEMREEKYYTDRNKDIVDECDVLVACPRGAAGVCEKCRHGTCATARYARRVGKPVIVVLQDGRVVVDSLTDWQAMIMRRMT